MRTASIRFIWAVVLLLSIKGIALAVSDEPYCRVVEIRAVWMDRRSIPDTEEDIRRLVRTYDEAGINVLFPEVIFNGYAAYPSSYLPEKNLWGGSDMLRIVLDEAHKRDMEVHGWVWAFRAGYTEDPGGIIPGHPDWAAVDIDGESLTPGGSYWLSPANPAVRHLLLRTIEELVTRYPVDGLHLDYIRLPSPDYSYDEVSRQKFEAEFGIDPLSIEPFTPAARDWHAWREEQINTFVRRISEEVHGIRPEIKVSAAVASIPRNARLNYLQDWENWAANKWADFLCPMDYTDSPSYFRTMVTRSDEAIDNRTLFAPGIGLNLIRQVDTMLEEIEIVRLVPASGVSIFATAYLDASELTALREGPFRLDAELPFRTPVNGVKRLMESAREKLRGDVSPDDIAQAQIDVESASALLEYTAYQQSDVGYVAPSPPSMFIPEVVAPLPVTTVPFVEEAPVLDGRLDDPIWESAALIKADTTIFGCPAALGTEVHLAYDTSNLYIGFRSDKCVNDRSAADVTQRDGPVFNDDSVEFFLSVAPDGKDYWHLAANTLGTRYDARVFNAAPNPEWQVAVDREENTWVAEVAIPFSSLGLSGPPTGTSWRANFCRNRMMPQDSEQEDERICWSPTYGTYHTPIRFGTLIFAERGT